MEHGFDFFVAGIEDGMIAALKPAMPYVKEWGTYGGELDTEQLRRALGELTPRMPLVLVSYEDGEDVESPATAPLPGEPRVFKHDCGFAVIVVSGDARGDLARRRGKGQDIGAYKMIADAKSALDCLQFKVVDGDETVLLNPEPLKPAGVDYIARLPQLTAYAIHYDTYFKYLTPDRTTTGPLVQELIFEVENTYPKDGSNLPGVVLS